MYNENGNRNFLEALKLSGIVYGVALAICMALSLPFVLLMVFAWGVPDLIWIIIALSFIASTIAGLARFGKYYGMEF